MKTLSVEEIKGSLTSRKRTAIMAGCILLMLAVSVFGVSISTILAQLLDRMNAASEFSLITLLASIAACIFTPVGGRISDMIGTKNVILIGGLGAAISGILMAFVNNAFIFMILRFILGASLGLYVAAPYTLLYEIYDRSKVPSMMGLLSAALACGGMIGGLIAGFFADNGILWAAVAYPVIFVLPGTFLVYFMLPQKHLQKSKFDLVGLLLMAAGITLFFLGLNEGPKTGWLQLSVLGEVFGGLALIAAFFVV
jgi:MFS family permease